MKREIRSRSASLSLALLTLGFALLPLAAQAQTNGVMMQYFHWYTDPADPLWVKVASEAQSLSAAGITALWLPPAYKGTNGNDVGYGPYDLYDLGEFNQKGSIRTRYGNRSEYQAAIDAAHAAGVQISRIGGSGT